MIFFSIWPDSNNFIRFIFTIGLNMSPKETKRQRIAGFNKRKLPTYDTANVSMSTVNIVKKDVDDTRCIQGKRGTEGLNKNRGVDLLTVPQS